VRSQGRVGAKGVIFLARWPSKKAVQHARDRIRELTARRRLLHRVDWIVEDLNRFLRGWAAYFRYGNSADQFDKINRYTRMRMAIVIAKRHRRSRSFGWYVVAFASSNQLGLIDLTTHGTVVAPRPLRAWRDRPNAGGERRR
jgi:RNA-directed DNA polymerase